MRTEPDHTGTQSRTAHYLPREVAEMLRISIDKVLLLIHSGELVAADLSSPGSSRPRYKIDPLELAIFLKQRSTRSQPKASRKRKKLDREIIKYF